MGYNKKWILSYGSEAEVLEPEDLREEIIAGLRETLDLYGVD